MKNFVLPTILFALSLSLFFGVSYGAVCAPGECGTDWYPCEPVNGQYTYCCQNNGCPSYACTLGGYYTNEIDQCCKSVQRFDVPVNEQGSYVTMVAHCKSYESAGGNCLVKPASKIYFPDGIEQFYCLCTNNCYQPTVTNPTDKCRQCFGTSGSEPPSPTPCSIPSYSEWFSPRDMYMTNDPVSSVPGSYNGDVFPTTGDLNGNGLQFVWQAQAGFEWCKPYKSYVQVECPTANPPYPRTNIGYYYASAPMSESGQTLFKATILANSTSNGPAPLPRDATCRWRAVLENYAGVQERRIGVEGNRNKLKDWSFTKPPYTYGNPGPSDWFTFKTSSYGIYPPEGALTINNDKVCLVPGKTYTINATASDYENDLHTIYIAKASRNVATGVTGVPSYLSSKSCTNGSYCTSISHTYSYTPQASDYGEYIFNILAFSFGSTKENSSSWSNQRVCSGDPSANSGTRTDLADCDKTPSQTSNPLLEDEADSEFVCINSTPIGGLKNAMTDANYTLATREIVVPVGQTLTLKAFGVDNINADLASIGLARIKKDASDIVSSDVWSDFSTGAGNIAFASCSSTPSNCVVTKSWTTTVADAGVWTAILVVRDNFTAKGGNCSGNPSTEGFVNQAKYVNQYWSEYDCDKDASYIDNVRVFVCSPTAPSAPSLISPQNNSTLNNHVVTFVWSPPQNPGLVCEPGVNNPQISYKVKASGVSVDGSCPTTLSSYTTLGTVADTTFTDSGFFVRGQEYCWYVEAKNTTNSLTSVSATRKFKVKTGIAADGWMSVFNGDFFAKNGFAQSFPNLGEVTMPSGWESYFSLAYVKNMVYTSGDINVTNASSGSCSSSSNCFSESGLFAKDIGSVTGALPATFNFDDLTLDSISSSCENLSLDSGKAYKVSKECFESFFNNSGGQTKTYTINGNNGIAVLYVDSSEGITVGNPVKTNSTDKGLLVVTNADITFSNRNNGAPWGENTMVFQNIAAGTQSTIHAGFVTSGEIKFPGVAAGETPYDKPIVINGLLVSSDFSFDRNLGDSSTGLSNLYPAVTVNFDPKYMYYLRDYSLHDTSGYFAPLVERAFSYE